MSEELKALAEAVRERWNDVRDVIDTDIGGCLGGIAGGCGACQGCRLDEAIGDLLRAFRTPSEPVSREAEPDDEDDAIRGYEVTTMGRNGRAISVHLDSQSVTEFLKQDVYRTVHVRPLTYLRTPEPVTPLSEQETS